MKISRTALRYFSVSYLIWGMIAVEVLVYAYQDVDPYSQYYFEAGQYYEQGDYHKALEHFQEAISLNPSFLERNPNVQFKVAYSYYQTEQYYSAIEIFENDTLMIDKIADYVSYFNLNSHLALGDTNTAIKQLHRIKQIRPSTPLSGKIDSMLAALYFQRGRMDSAKIHYERMLRFRKFDKGEIYARLIDIARQRKHFRTMQTEAFKLLNKYPFHPECQGAYQLVLERYPNQLIPESKLGKLFRYLSKTDQFSEIERLLAEQSKLGGETELIRWLRIRKMYVEEMYWETFQACKSQRAGFKNLSFLREVDLHVARCYLRLGFIDKAIEAYDIFRSRYPKDRLAPEVLWVTGWLSEEQGRIAEARDYYQELVRRYPHYEFVREANFRTGLSYYREEDYTTAREIWQRELARKVNNFWQARFRYWIAKTHLQEQNISLYREQLTMLTDRPFDNYYTLKSFLLTRTGNEVHSFLDSLVWETHQQVTYLPDYLENMQRPLLVQELLGDDYAQNEMNYLSQNLKNSNWELLFALGEVNEQIENFGRAYRLYRQVYNKRFSRKNWNEWTFLLKRLYPLYFTSEVTQYAEKWNIKPASIWAIMKKESAFEPQIMSYANAYGLMQIIPPTANQLSRNLGIELDDIRQLYDPEFNIHLGSYYLSELVKRYEGNLYHALAAYNAGEHRVDRWRKVIETEDDDLFMENIEFEQTRGYVRGVMKFYWTYHILIDPQELPELLAAFPEKVAREPWLNESGLN